MGLPQAQDPANEPPSQPQQQPSSTTSTTKSINALPPEAIALATKLFDFARAGQTAELSQYLSAGIPVNLTNHTGDTLLMLASYHGHLNTVELLLGKSADCNVLNDRGQSVIAGAVFKDHIDVVRALKGADADLLKGQPNAVDSARMFKRVDCLRMFGLEEEAAEVEAAMP